MTKIINVDEVINKSEELIILIDKLQIEIDISFAKIKKSYPEMITLVEIEKTEKLIERKSLLINRLSLYRKNLGEYYNNTYGLYDEK